MNFRDAQHMIPQHDWWSEECPGKWQYCYWMHSWVEQRAYFHPDYLSVAFLTVKNNFIQEKTSIPEKLQIYTWLKERYQEDFSYLDEEYERWVSVRDEIPRLYNEIVHHLDEWDSQEIMRVYHALRTVAIDSGRWGVMIECADVYSENVLPTLLQEAFPDINAEACQEILSTLTAPLIMSFMDEFQIEKAECILEHRTVLTQPNSALNAELNAALKNLLYRFQWISVNYGGSPPLTVESLLHQLQDDAQHYSDAELQELIQRMQTTVERKEDEQAILLRTNEFPQDLFDDFSLLRTLGRWMDERKESMVKTSFCLRALLEALSQQTQVPREDLEWYCTEELDELIQTGERVDSASIAKRQLCSVYVTTYDGEESSIVSLFLDADAEHLYQLLNPLSSQALQGKVAAKSFSEQATFSGTAQIVLDITTDSFTPGNILVTSMTRPEFLPLMKKASAIITDEGGLTCHAAIVSRELGIPCIIGTKHATRLLRSGDQVLCNMQTGEISIQYCI